LAAETLESPFWGASAMGEITYQGESPFRLTTSQPASARAVRSSVELIVYGSVHLQPPDAFEIQIPISLDDAQHLSAELRKAILAAEAEKRKGR
jgi:hypothetical protein